MTLSTFAAGVAIVAITAYLKLLEKEDEKKEEEFLDLNKDS